MHDAEPDAEPARDPFDVPGGLPGAPSSEARAGLFAELRRLIELGGWERFVRAPVPNDPRSIPEARADGADAVGWIALRLLDHAGVALDVEVRDERPAGAIDRTTRVALAGVEGGTAVFQVERLGVRLVDALLDPVGAAIVLALAANSPYREAPPERGEALRRAGAVASIYAGLGALASAAALRFSPALNQRDVPAAVTTVGLLGVDEVAFLVAVQALVRGGPPPDELGGTQTDAIAAWCDALAGRGAALRDALGVPPPETWGDATRPPPAPLARTPVIVEAARPAVGTRPVRTAPAGFLLAGGSTMAAALALSGSIVFSGGLAVAAGLGGALLGRRVRIERCTACGSWFPERGTICPRCGGVADR